MYDHSMGMRLFTLIMNRIFLWAPRSMRKVSTASTWTCSPSRTTGVFHILEKWEVGESKKVTIYINIAFFVHANPTSPQTHGSVDYSISQFREVCETQLRRIHVPCMQTWLVGWAETAHTAVRQGSSVCILMSRRTQRTGKEEGNPTSTV